ncbi:MAG: ACT domain-containing protein [Oscillospiraceae bacterium]|jgi:chorismate mutase|nr:ACT domain-containing protein [Oscillospiraceae bacterium]
MDEKAVPKYLLVEAGVLPEVFVKVTQVQELLETGEVKTVADAVERIGISRSAYYKYKDSVRPFRDMKQGGIVTFNALLRDKKGILSSLLAIFADTGANILTINQSIPTNGAALVTISATTENMPVGVDELIAKARGQDGVIRFDALAG